MSALIEKRACIEVNSPFRVGIIGVGEAILEYSYPALRKLEREGRIRIVSMSDRYDLNKTRENLTVRQDKYPKERESVEEILGRFANGEIKHYKTDGDRFNSSSNGVFNSADMFYLATPNNVRLGLVDQIARAGKNLIIEKPVGHTSGVVNDIVDVRE